MECEHCHKLCRNKYALKFHKQSSKKCLQIRGEEKTIIKCKYCNKLCANYQGLILHQENSQKCHDKKNVIENISMLSDKVANLAANLDKDLYCEECDKYGHSTTALCLGMYITEGGYCGSIGDGIMEGDGIMDY